MTPTPRQALEGVLAAAGLDPATAAAVALDGADPVLPSGFRLGTAGAATLGAVGVAADRLWRRRGGGPQAIGLDLRAAAMALRTERHVTVDGAPPQSPWSPISGFYQAGCGRWIQFHCNFPHHRDGVLRLLGAENDRAAVAARVAGRRAAELEDRLAEAGMCAAMLRSRAEWLDHAQGRAVAGLPLVEIARIGDAPAEPVDRRAPGARRPLAGVRVLDLSRVIAGPVAGRTLAEHGATVMRISAPHLPFVPPLLLDTGHGKVNAEIDLARPGGPERLAALLAEADVMVQAYRPETLARRGFGPEDAARIRPGIVYVSLSAYGGVGPWGGRRGFDTLVQTASGLAAEESGGLGARPRHLPAQALDYATAYLAAFGAMVALERRADEGGSWHVRLSLAATARWLDGLGRVPDAEAARARPDPGPDQVADLMTETESPFGRIRHLRPALAMSATPPGWDRPPAPLASHPPAWPQ
ncbi:CoA transferase [Stella sp.]|uniref:CoA transferase n=1 Tax=Stella sp. TaxID=2912054 RepID=UPI0035ADCC5D